MRVYRTMRAIFLMIALMTTFAPAYAAQEISFFNSSGEAVAYVAVDHDLTIYLWEGKPVAYLVPLNDTEFNVFSFGGTHLGWFVSGLLRDHEGNAACAVKGAISMTNLEGLKGLKELKPLKGLKELTPLRPLFSSTWSQVPCEGLLQQ